MVLFLDIFNIYFSSIALCLLCQPRMLSSDSYLSTCEASTCQPPTSWKKGKSKLSKNITLRTDSSFNAVKCFYIPLLHEEASCNVFNDSDFIHSVQNWTSTEIFTDWFTLAFPTIWNHCWTIQNLQIAKCEIFCLV